MDEIIIGYWDLETFEIALWKTKRLGEKVDDSKSTVYISRQELLNHYQPYNLSKLQKSTS